MKDIINNTIAYSKLMSIVNDIVDDIKDNHIANMSDATCDYTIEYSDKLALPKFIISINVSICTEMIMQQQFYIETDSTYTKPGLSVVLPSCNYIMSVPNSEQRNIDLLKQNMNKINEIYAFFGSVQFYILKNYMETVYRALKEVNEDVT